MPRIDFRLAPLFLCVATLFAPAALADDATPAQPIAASASAAAATDGAAPAAPASAPANDGSPAPAKAPRSVTPTIALPVIAIPDNTASDSPPASADMSAAAQADLWARLRKGFKLADVDTPQVRQAERFYASKPEYMQRVAERSRRYLYFIVGEVEKRGMPTEIALLPIVESAFMPHAESQARASGLWQFIPSTGQRYGLERTWWYDGRQDVMAATYAALDYLQDLYNQFGDWQLALAAYNWGEGGVGRALAKTRARGLEDSFDSIRKPNETASYVPKLIAIRNLIANPDAYGLTLPDMPNKPYFEPVSTGRHIDVQLAAKLADTSVEEILHLNPGLIRPVFAYKDDRKLLLPAEKVETFEENLRTYDKPLLSWQPYVTHHGESIAAIAGKFGMSVAELNDVNKLGNARTAKGQTILVPIRTDIDASDRQNLAALISGAVAGSNDGAPAAAQPKSHRVARGETLASIARRYGIKPASLRAMNGLHSDRVAEGTTLKLSDGGEQVAHGESRHHDRQGERGTQYVVKRGDTLDEIARAHDVSVSDLKHWNKSIAHGALKVGYKLAIRG
ncbi:MAG: LysM peptidoglycan-binding domain-containing protein [Burkholderiales bacterium]|nr:LysM peptidoglycan-binding domain-containing protein [Burkholderiales bacterium]